MPEASVDVAASMASFVEMVGKPTNWQDVKTSVQVEGEVQKNVMSAIELATRAKRQWTSDQVKAREAAITSVITTRNDLVERLLDGIDGISPDQRRAFLDRARAWRMESIRAIGAAHG